MAEIRRLIGVLIIDPIRDIGRGDDSRRVTMHDGSHRLVARIARKPYGW